MSELRIPKVEKADIYPPRLEVGASAIILARHEKYHDDPADEAAGSLVATEANRAFRRNVAFFQDVFEHDTERRKTMVLFVASDTQYAGKGYRSMESAQLAQEAAIQALYERDINPSDQIINLSPHFSTHAFTLVDRTAQFSIRPDPRLREPQIFATPDYVNFLIEKYNEEPGAYRLSKKAWAAHEMDAERTKREELGAEGVYDILERTRTSLAIMERYAKIFHANNPNTNLLIWASSHYDTISPLVKDAAKIGFDTFLPVEYGGGIVVKLEPRKDPSFIAQRQRIQLQLGGKAARAIV